ncbi:unnamed protein product [Moneuplotes crassus]|uniref:Uncharacterized protein n=1 Tax=Euplotes crassus TaxID=5936 RepID=A0AAD1XSP7_EUPCR|nr:unnamed protein product [Moneuplotes crassus]
MAEIHLASSLLMIKYFKISCLKNISLRTSTIFIDKITNFLIPNLSSHTHLNSNF